MRVVLIVRLILIAGIVLAARAAFGQTPPESSRCDVHVLRAPDKVKAAIEARIRAERRCETSLVVRVVPTTTGLYLLAHTPGGQTYEMVVPDTQTAGDFVVLWAARREQVARPAVTLEPPPTAPPPISAISADLDPIGPRVVPRARAPREELAVRETRDGSPRSASGSGKWLSLAGVLGDDVFGARGEIDVLGRGGWAGGIGFEASAMRMIFNEPTAAVLDFKDARAVATVGYTLGRGAWQVRVQAGVGVVHSTMSGYLYDRGVMRPVASEGVYPVGEAELQVMRTLGARWAFAAGPMATVYSQTYRIDGSDMVIARRDLDVSLAAGLRRKL